MLTEPLNKAVLYIKFGLASKKQGNQCRFEVTVEERAGDMGHTVGSGISHGECIIVAFRYWGKFVQMK